MTGFRSIFAAVWIGLMLPAGFSQAQTPEPGKDLVKIESELAQLNESVAQLVLLLKEQIQANQIALLMKRLEMKHALLRPLEAELRGVRDDIRKLESQQAQMDMELESLGEDRTGDVGTDEAFLAQQEREIQQARKRLKDQLWNLNQRALDLEQELARGREETRAMEEQIEQQFLPKP